MGWQLSFLPVLFAAAQLVAGQCSCSNSLCYLPVDVALACMEAIPFDPSWADSTLDTLTTTLDFYSFRDLMKSTGPPFSIKLDLITSLEALRSVGYVSDVDFQEDVQMLLTSTHDAHTIYTKPLCYSLEFVQPFVFNVSLNSNNQVEYRLAASDYLDEYDSYYGGNSSTFLGKQIELIDGTEAQTKIADWGDQQEPQSNDASARFNVALSTFLNRFQLAYPRPSSLNVTFHFTDGSEVSTPWLGVFNSDFFDPQKCIAQPKSQSRPSLYKHAPVVLSTNFETQDSRHYILEPGRPSSIMCFTTNQAGANVLVMKVGSFDFDNSTGFLSDAQTCLNHVVDHLLIDVMQNGGGTVCLGKALLRMVVSDFWEDESKSQMLYDMGHNSFLDTYHQIFADALFGNCLDPATGLSFVPLEAVYTQGRSVTQGGVTSVHSSLFWLNCSSLDLSPFRPKRFSSKVSVLTDGTCGSTCALFIKVLQESSRATILGAGGLWRLPMDSSSFAGGFISNPSYFNVMDPTFPVFETSAQWNFNWAVGYSTLDPTRPMQFVPLEPDVRIPFWTFPHHTIPTNRSDEAVSQLYDDAIMIVVNRAQSVCGAASQPITAIAVLGALLGVSVLVLIAVIFYFKRRVGSDGFQAF